MSSSQSATSAASQNAIDVASGNSTIWLIVLTLSNIGPFLMKNAVFAKADFPYPYFLSAVHMVCSFVGSQFIFCCQRRKQMVTDYKLTSGTETDLSTDKDIIEKEAELDGPSKNGGSLTAAASSSSLIVRLLGNINRQTLDTKGRCMILAFSVIIILNGVMGNVSLRHVSFDFAKVMSSLVAAITVMMERFVGKSISTKRQIAVVPVVIGVAMTTFGGDMSYDAMGLFYTVCFVLLVASKVVASSILLTGSTKLHPVDLLAHMAPLVLIQCLALSFWTGEVAKIASRWSTDLSPAVSYYPMAALWFSGLLSFFLNICSLQANKLTSPLTLCIAGNVKQVLMVIVGTCIFESEITPLNGIGIVVVLIGSARYSYVSITEKIASSKGTFSIGSYGFEEAADDNTIRDGNADEDIRLVKPKPFHIANAHAQTHVSDHVGRGRSHHNHNRGPSASLHNNSFLIRSVC